MHSVIRDQIDHTNVTKHMSNIVNEIQIRLNRTKPYFIKHGLDINVQSFSTWHDILRLDMIDEFHWVRQQCNDNQWWYLLSEKFVYNTDLSGFNARSFTLENTMDYLRLKSDFVFPIR